MNNKQLVSIITVSYNCAEKIEKTIQSVLKLSYRPIEYIVIDGGSTDGTKEIIEKYESYLSYWVSEPDQGIYDAMNKGLSISSGELIGFMNAGDTYVEDSVDNVIKVYNETQADILYGNSKIVYRDHIINKNYANSKLRNYLRYNLFIHQAIFVKGVICRNNPFNLRYKILSDYHFFIHRFYEGAKFAYVDSDICYFEAGGISGTNPYRCMLEKRNILKELVEEMPHINQKDIEKMKDTILYELCQNHILCIPDYWMWLLEYTETLKRKYGKIILYAAGELLNKTLSYVKIDAEYIVDRNPTKVGDTINGKKVYSPEKLYYENEGLLLILSEEHSDEIVDNIREMRINENIHLMTYREWCIEAERSFIEIV